MHGAPLSTAERLIIALQGPQVLVSARVASRIAPTLMEKLRRELRHGEQPDDEEAATAQAIDTLARAFVSHGLTRRSGRRSGSGTPAPAEAPGSRMLAPMSVEQAASELGCGRRNVLALAQRGTLAGSKVGRSWVFDPTDVADLARARNGDR